jgi:hypothetical protein
VIRVDERGLQAAQLTVKVVASEFSSTEVNSVQLRLADTVNENESVSLGFDSQSGGSILSKSRKRL